MAPEPPREAKCGTIVRLDYGGYCRVTLCSCPTLTRRGGLELGRGQGSLCLRLQSCGGHDVQVKLLSSGRVHIGRRRRGGSRRPHS
ncbi:hypothetical protein Taro_054597 [Colocasia esculenta]|uniref:Uncharacterized protein n=1 Tax=Colocasia esculenta TaxID=4460 RepID=A0A843XRN6_COLES|nr:hypothetical protein [Colocasia esculenta]